MQIKPQLLLIEDNESIATALVEALRNEYEIEFVREGKSGLYKTDQTDYDLILLDLNLPDAPGLAICQQLRERGITIPIFIVSGETKVLSKINLLDAGANDYLTKPFSLGELKARLRALIRIGEANTELTPREIEIGSLCLKPSELTVYREGKPLSLRNKEFSILHCLMAHAGSVVSRETLTRYAWHGSETPWANTIDVHIKYLRDKVDKPFDAPAIKTVHGIGYKLDISALTKVKVRT